MIGPFKFHQADKLSTRPLCESVSNKARARRRNREVRSSLWKNPSMTSFVVYRTMIVRSSSEANCEHENVLVTAFSN